MKQGPYRKMSISERFLSKVDVCGPDDCWEWLACRNTLGYGQFRINGRGEKAHRVSYQFHYGPIPEGLHVLHSCDNPSCDNPSCDNSSCVNPVYLHLRTHQDNMDEMYGRNRRKVAVGERASKSKLTVEQVKEIRRRYVNEDIIQAELASEFLVARPQISYIVNQKTWRHV